MQPVVTRFAPSPTGLLHLGSAYSALVAHIRAREAGGRFTSLAGKDGPWGGNAVATNGILHDEVLERIGTDTRA